MTLWHGRFSGQMDQAMADYTVSLSFDQALAVEDLLGSTAHVEGLVHVGLLTLDEGASLLAALETVGQELASGAFIFDPSDEDIHTAVERRVTEIAGPTGAKLHTGRSRNDQVATDLRLWTKRELSELQADLLEVCRVLEQRATEAGSTYLPGYTHVQRAQPVLLAHHFLAHGWALLRDVDRLRECRERLDVSPLGAGALAGSSLPLDPDFVAARLGFARRFENSMDVVSDRDFVAEALFDLSMIGIHLSRMGEELVLWSSEEFGFCTLDDGFSSGSSMLPQKKNADAAELARGKSGRLIGNLTGLLVTLKGLPLSYNRDLQEDKEPLFDSVRQVRLGLRAMAGAYATLTIHPEVMQRAADGGSIAAIDLAEYLVVQHVPFREAHAIVASLVRMSIDEGTSLSELVEAHPQLGKDAAALLAPGIAVTRRTTPGGAGPVPVAVQLDRFRAAIEGAGR
ncbi:MAG: argininosuccinate lyase [Actinomycetota bacterium]